MIKIPSAFHETTDFFTMFTGVQHWTPRYTHIALSRLKDTETTYTDSKLGLHYKGTSTCYFIISFTYFSTTEIEQSVLRLRKEV